MQPLGAIMPIAETQSAWLCDHLAGRYHLPPQAELRADIEAERAAMFKRYVRSKRHTMQVDFDDWMLATRQGARGGRRAGARGGQRPAGAAAGGGARVTVAAGRRERTKAANRAAILRAALEAFGELGYEGVAVRDIVRRTELASGTFYNYFATRTRSSTRSSPTPPRRPGAACRTARAGARDRAELVERGYRAYFEWVVEDPVRFAFLRRNLARGLAGVLPAGVRELAADLARHEAPGEDLDYLAHAMVAVGVELGARMAEREPPDVAGADPLRDGAVRPAGVIARRLEIASVAAAHETPAHGDRRRPLAVHARDDVSEHRDLRPPAADVGRGVRGRARRVAPRPHAVPRLGRVRRPRAARVRAAGGRARATSASAGRSPRSPGSSRRRCPTARGCSRVEGDFTSVLFPFLAQAPRGVTVELVPLERLAEALAPHHDLVAFSVVQSADGRIADVDAVLAAAAAHDVRTFADTTQSTSWLAARPRPLRPHGVRGLQVAVRPARDGVLHAAARAARRADPARRRLVRGGGGARRPTTARRCGSRGARGASTSRRPGTAGWARRRRSSSWPSSGPSGSARTTSRWPNRLRDGLGSRRATPRSCRSAASRRTRRTGSQAAGVMAAGRGGALRLSCHLYTTDEDVDRALAVLRSR